MTKKSGIDKHTYSDDNYSGLENGFKEEKKLKITTNSLNMITLPLS